MHLEFLFMVGDDNSLIYGAQTKLKHPKDKCCLIFRVTIKFD